MSQLICFVMDVYSEDISLEVAKSIHPHLHIKIYKKILQMQGMWLHD